LEEVWSVRTIFGACKVRTCGGKLMPARRTTHMPPVLTSMAHVLTCLLRSCSAPGGRSTDASPCPSTPLDRQWGRALPRATLSLPDDEPAVSGLKQSEAGVGPGTVKVALGTASGPQGTRGGLHSTRGAPLGTRGSPHVVQTHGNRHCHPAHRPSRQASRIHVRVPT